MKTLIENPRAIIWTITFTFACWVGATLYIHGGKLERIDERTLTTIETVKELKVMVRRLCKDDVDSAYAAK